MNRSIVLGLAALALSAGSAAAAGPQATRMAHRLAHISLFQATLHALADSETAELIKAHPELQPDQVEQVKAAEAAALRDLEGPLLDKVGDIYAETFTAGELSRLVVFFESATGRAYAAKEPTTLPAIGALLKGVDFKMELAKRYCAKPGNCPEPAKPASAPVKP